MADSLHRVNGLPVLPYVLQEHVNQLKHLELFPDDVWIVSYPRCGSTWTQQILRLVRSNGEKDCCIKNTDAIPLLEAKADVVLSLEAFCPKFNIEDLPRPRAFRSHFPYDLLPCGPPHNTPCRYIYVARNPKDVVVSNYYALKELPEYCDLKWDTFWDKHMKGNNFYGDYLDHILSWWPHRDDENVLFLKYEDMKKDLPQTISQIASFLGVNLSGHIISKIADLSSFEKMKKDNTVNFSWVKAFNKDGVSTFIRKGLVGDWKSVLTPDQSAQMDVICTERLKDTGLEFVFDL